MDNPLRRFVFASMRATSTWSRHMTTAIASVRWRGKGAGYQRAVIGDSRSRRDVSSCFQNILIFPRRSFANGLVLLRSPRLHASHRQCLKSSVKIFLPFLMLLLLPFLLFSATTTFFAVFCYYYVHIVTKATVVTANFID